MKFTKEEIENAERLKNNSIFKGSYVEAVLDILRYQDRGKLVVQSNLILAYREWEKLKGSIEQNMGEVERLRTALEFYADESKYTHHEDEAFTPIEIDDGQIARNVLKGNGK